MINSEAGKMILATTKSAKSVISGNNLAQVGFNFLIGGSVSALLAAMD